jgi:hypothetical protein
MVTLPQKEIGKRLGPELGYRYMDIVDYMLLPLIFSFQMAFTFKTLIILILAQYFCHNMFLVTGWEDRHRTVTHLSLNSKVLILKNYQQKLFTHCSVYATFLTADSTMRVQLDCQKWLRDITLVYILDTLHFKHGGRVLHLSTNHPLYMAAHSTMLSLTMTLQWYQIWKQEQSHHTGET